MPGAPVDAKEPDPAPVDVEEGESASSDDDYVSEPDLDDEEGTPDRALWDAIKDNDIEATRAALKAGGNPNR